MTAIYSSIEEYLFTIGILISFFGLLAGLYFSRKSIRDVFSGFGLDRRKLLLSLAVVAIFIVAEFSIVKPTQQLFFDDTIYQDMALNILSMGQAWMCTYGTAHSCIIGSAFHEPIGTSFLLALGFMAFGVSRGTAYGTMFAISAFSVFMTFVVALLLTRKFLAAIFAEFIMALSPVMLVWAYPTTSDMPMLAISLVAISLMLLFIEKRNVATFFTALMGLSFLLYMKIDGVVFLVLIPIMYILLSDNGIVDSVIKNFKRLSNQLLNTKFLAILLIALIAMGPEIGFAANELVFGSFGYQGAYVQPTCAVNKPSFEASNPIDLQNFGANLCSNLGYWINLYANIDIIQPIAFTALAIIGVAMMLVMKRRRQLFALAVWFGAFFLLYTSFYAGGVLYGVDWRFMLSLAAPAAILGGFGVYGLVMVLYSLVGGNHAKME